MIKVCTKCGYHNVVQAKFCIRCGAKLGIATDEANLISESPATPPANAPTPTPANQSAADSQSANSEADNGPASVNASNPYQQFNSTSTPAQQAAQPVTESPSIGQRTNKNSFWIIILGLAVVLTITIMFLGKSGFGKSDAEKRADLTSEFNKQLEDKGFSQYASFDVKSNDLVVIHVKSDLAREAEEIIANGQDSSYYDDWSQFTDGVTKMSSNLQKNYGNGITIEVLNPDNESRTIFSVKDGTVTYDVTD